MNIYRKKSIGEKAFDIINLIFFVLFSITILLPFINQAVRSISTEATIISKGFYLIPDGVTLDNWKTILSSGMMWRSFFNTVYVVIMGAGYSLLISVTFAYPLSRKDLPHRNFFTFIAVFTMFFSGGLIPTYLLMRSLGLVNNLAVLILGGLNVWNTLILRNFFMAIPNSLQESAKIDGASDPIVLFRIILPLSMPVLATVTLWNLVGGWNSWVGCMIYITDPRKQVLQIILRQIMFMNIRFDTDADFMRSIATTQDKLKNNSIEGLKATTLLFVIAPILMTYPFLQKYFVKGIMIGSLKG